MKKLDISLKKASKDFQKEHSDSVIDVIAFGSALKGASKPRDIDITLITKVNKAQSLKLATKFERLVQGVHVTYHIIDDMFQKPESIWQSLFHEGLSLISGTNLAENLGFQPKILYKYDSSVLEYKEKIKLYYALKGRKGNGGILSRTGSEYLSKTVLLVSVKYDNEFQEFFKQWKLPFSRRVILISK